MTNALNALVDKGDKVACLAPFFSAYKVKSLSETYYSTMLKVVIAYYLCLYFVPCLSV